MGYDTRSQIFDECIASAKAALPVLRKGLQTYLDLGIPPHQLVMGVPWYGYNYPCAWRGRRRMNGSAQSERCPFAA
jgi:di-N-acetylchitobiase